MYCGGGTELQKEAGFDDTAEELFKYLRLESVDTVGDEALEAFCDTSLENHEWVKGFGVPYPFGFEKVKTSYPRPETTLYYSGNESSTPFCDEARTAARGHRAYGKGLTGKVFFEPLRKAALERGVRFHPYSRCRSLIADEEGRIVGAEVTIVRFPVLKALAWLCNVCASNLGAISTIGLWAFGGMLRGFERLGRTKRIRARGGVVLSTGGFIFNRKLIKQHVDECRKTLRLGTVADDGFGIEEGIRHGAATGRMDRSAIWLFFDPPRSCLHGVLLSRKGERVCSEELYGASLAMHMVAKHDARAIMLIDRRIWKQIRQDLKTNKQAHFQVLTAFTNLYLNRNKAKDLTTLERKCKMPEGSLTAAVERYNAGVDAGRDEMGKKPELLQRLDTPPYYAINVDIATTMMLTPSMTLGGLKVNGLTAQVLREDGSAIDGLYAAGRAAVGVCSHSYLTGLAIADCIFSGRNAGRSAAAVAASQRQA